MNIRTALHASAWTKFAPDAFEETVGKTIPLHAWDETYQAKVLRAVVSPDGESVSVTLEVPEMHLGIANLDAPAFNFYLDPPDL